MSLCMPLTVSPARIEANRPNRQLTIEDRQFRCSLCRAPRKEILFSTDEAGMCMKKQNEDKMSFQL